MAIRKAPGEQLNDKEIEFAKAYIKNQNAIEAYRAVYYKGGTKKTVAEQASRKLRMPGMPTKIAQLQRELIKEWKVDNIWLFEQYFMLYQSALAKGKERDAKCILDSLGKYLGIDKLDMESLAKVVLYAPDNGRVKKDAVPS